MHVLTFDPVIGMAQDFVGSNNLNLLVPSGQFGTRLTGGDDAASPRYIFTYLSPATRYLFPEDDDILLEYLEDDGQMIEPKFYCPIIPLLLVNGSHGIGTGWSTSIPSHNPMSVIDYVRAKLEKRLDPPLIEPYSRGFRGAFERLDTGKGYKSSGVITTVDDKTVQIDELPVGVWTDAYKAHLLRMQTKGIVSDFIENHTTTKVSFTVRLKPSQLKRMESTGLTTAFRLKSNHLLTNMNAFDEFGQIQKFTSAEAIADAHFPIRLSLYHDRKSVLQSNMEYIAAKQRNKARFIQFVSDGELGLIGGKVSRHEASQMLFDRGFNTAADLEVIRSANSLSRRHKELDIISEREYELSHGTESDYDYLLQMPLFSLTREKIESLKKEAEKVEDELKTVRATEPEELWMNDLDKLAKHL
jgi:DNA topoisomerase II